MSYYYKKNDMDFGPVEERTVIAKLIDGEINSRTLVKDRYDGSYSMLLETDFNAILGHLTARWRYNIGALKREFIYLMVSLAVWLVPLLSYLGGLFNSEVREFLFHYKVMGVFGFLSFVGFFSTCYFSWMFAYRLWRVVPKSQYKITPGWRIMLTYIPFFRFGWNYCMYLPLANKLRALTNYSMKTGKVAAHFYCIGVIVLSCSIWAVAVLPWSYSMLNGIWHEALWENILGWLFIVLLVVSFGITLVSFIIMAQKMKLAALAILRHRYAYNVCTQTKNSVFLESMLKRQRHYDKTHRWGHGLGIGGVLVGWPLLLIGIPVLVLFIVGSCKYEKTKYMLKSSGMPSALADMYAYNNVQDNGLDDVRNLKDCVSEDELEQIFAHRNLTVPADWLNLRSDINDLQAVGKLCDCMQKRIEKNAKAQNMSLYHADIEKYLKLISWLQSSAIPEIYHLWWKSFDELADILEKYPVSDIAMKKKISKNLSEIRHNMNFYCTRQFVIINLIEEKKFDNMPIPFPPPRVPGEFWSHVFKMTPFMYFSKAKIYNAVVNIWYNVKINGDFTDAMLDGYEKSSFMILPCVVSQTRNMLELSAKIDKRLEKLIKGYGTSGK